jgi:hypothetical protein
LTASLTSHARRLTKRLCRLTGTGGIRLSDVEEGLLPADNPATAAQFPASGPIPVPSSTRRRALLVGIAYHGELLNTHQDVDRYRDVLIGKLTGYYPVAAQRWPITLTLIITILFVIAHRKAAYGYRPEDITVLKDDPMFDDHLQPTRENLVSFLSSPVSAVMGFLPL